MAMSKVLGNSQAIGQIYNISGDRYVTFKGLAQSCAVALGKNPAEIELKYYDPTNFNLGKKKAFPIRVQHFFADISKAQKDLQWTPKYDLISGLKESFENDYLPSGRDKIDLDFSLDREILSQL